MSVGYYPKDSQVFGRALKVQRLVIPLSITGNATPANKVLASDEASIVFLKAEGITQITSASGALDSGEATPVFDLTATDSSGDFNLLVRVNEQIVKIQHARVTNRATGVAYACYHNVSNPDTDALNVSMLLNCHTAVNLASNNLDLCLEIEYITQE